MFEFNLRVIRIRNVIYYKIDETFMIPCRFKEFMIEQMRSITIVISGNVVFRGNKLDDYRLIELNTGFLL